MTKEELQEYQVLENILNQSLLTALFQPIVSLTGQTIYGYEGLIRGPSDTALHSPLKLFDCASRHGKLAELDLLCRETVIKRFAELKLEGKLFVNTLPSVLLEQDYPQGVTAKLLRSLGISPSQVVIELTEHFPIDDYDVMRNATDHYREMGFSIAIDDLGAGYSGLRTWSELKPDYVKLDRHFMQNIHEDREKKQFVKLMLDIASNINCKFIGEGIEVRQEYLAADSCGMKLAQGYYFGRPSRYPQHKLDGGLFEQRKKVRSTSGRARADTLVVSLLTELSPLHEEDNFHTAAERFQHDLDLPALPVINNEYQVSGMVWRDNFMTLYASPYGRELHGRKAIRHFMDSQPITVETTLPLKNLSYQITSQETKLQRSMFIIADEGRYRGVGNLMDLLRRITDMQITSARHANPLSNLPGNVPISEQTRDAIEQKRDVTICYFDLDNFKPYNDIYGYSKGDNVISHTAKVLANNIDHDIDFLGHVGGDDFVILFESEDWQARCEKIFSDFSALYPDFYTKEHIQKGGIKAQDRYGNQAFYPLLSLSIGAVRMSDFVDLNSEAQLVECATHAKSLAKKKIGNSLHLLSYSDECHCQSEITQDLLEVSVG